ncbi:hypothetical protein M5K25_015794 [Dendrobium thyrsiflorum]|uniref:Uncharacterized protein n=1 Tax=Dendrobium thyrsiflorum TaxID=117978 RepID=A0ABD0UYC4_DENTH
MAEICLHSEVAAREVIAVAGLCPSSEGDEYLVSLSSFQWLGPRNKFKFVYSCRKEWKDIISHAKTKLTKEEEEAEEEEDLPEKGLPLLQSEEGPNMKIEHNLLAFSHGNWRAIWLINEGKSRFIA